MSVERGPGSQAEAVHCGAAAAAGEVAGGARGGGHECEAEVLGHCTHISQTGGCFTMHSVDNGIN